jgi:excisionase family DNA binding protein
VGPHRDTTPLEPLVSVEEAQRILGITRAGLYKCIGRGELPVVKVGRRALFDPADLRALIDSREERLARNAVTSCETLAMIAMPVALGFSYGEIAAQAGLSHAEVAQRMRNLRGELEAQVAARRAT